MKASRSRSADGLLPHLHARDVALLLVSQAPLAKIQAGKRRMGWSISVGLGGGHGLHLRFRRTRHPGADARPDLGEGGQPPTSPATRSAEAYLPAAASRIAVRARQR
jgi:Bacterial protein of unknown function (DUF899)